MKKKPVKQVATRSKASAGKVAKAPKGVGAKAPATAMPAGKLDARNPELEKAIVANPGDRDAWTVFADWLMEQGDPRGELASLQLGNKDGQAKKLLEKHAEYFLGPLAAHQKVHDSNANNSSSSLRTPAQEKEWQKTADQAFLWRNGFIHRCRLSHDAYSETWDGSTAELLGQVFAHPSGRFVVELAFQSNGDPNDDSLQSIIDVIGKKAPPTIRKITFGDNIDQISWHHTGSLAKMWKGVPNLRTLDIETGELEVGKMVAPKLEKLRVITGGLSPSCGKDIAKATMPSIKHLEIYYGTPSYGGDCTIKDVRPLLDRTDLPKLEYLGLKNSMFEDDIAKAIAGSKIVRQLKTLDLSHGAMTDEGALALAANPDAFAHLDVLDLSTNYIGAKGVAAVKKLCRKVITTDQQEPRARPDGTLRYYVSVTE